MMRAVSTSIASAMWIVLAAMHAPAVEAQDAILDTQEETQAAPTWTWFGDFWSGYDHVSGLPNNRDDLSRLRTSARAGALWTPAPAWEIGGAIRAALGTDLNRDNRRNNDNQRSDSIGLDRLFVRWKPDELTTATLGKTALPLDLSPMVWDSDLRPAGVSVDRSVALDSFDRLQFVVGYFAGQHLYGDLSRIGAAELAWRWHEGAPLHFSVIASYLDFSDLGELTQEGLARTNSIAGGNLVNDYRLGDVQLIGHVEAAGWPIQGLIDVVNNFGADDANQGIRGSIAVGDSTKPRGWEFGAAAQRIQRDAVMAAFNSDNWWFHSAVRGQMLWAAYGLDATWNLKLSGFHERRDGLTEYTDRITLELTANW